MPTVLIVEDNKPSRAALSRRLERRGYSVVPAVDGQRAVSRARAARPDSILMDLGLPVIDGWEATARLKRGDDVDTKPVTFDRLLEKMDTLLGKGTSR